MMKTNFQLTPSTFDQQHLVHHLLLAIESTQAGVSKTRTASQEKRALIYCYSSPPPHPLQTLPPKLGCSLHLPRLLGIKT
jgi:hypothetical protein